MPKQLMFNSFRYGVSLTHLRRNMINVAVIAITALAFCSAAFAQSYQSNSNRVSLSSGTVIPVILNTDLSSNGAMRNDTFSTSVDNNKEAYDNILHGATIMGVVREATPMNGNNPGMLDLGFTSLRLADGRTYPLSGSLTSMDPKQINIGNDGILHAKNSSKNNRLTYAGIGAGAGALVGLLNGGKLKIEDILLGGLAGYGVGSVIQSPQQVHDIELKQGTAMGVLLTQSVNFQRTAQTSSITRYHHKSNIQNGTKYYQYNGRSYAMNMATGERYLVYNNSSSSETENSKYYTYQGHPYRLDYTTGERTKLD